MFEARSHRRQIEWIEGPQRPRPLIARVVSGGGLLASTLRADVAPAGRLFRLTRLNVLRPFVAAALAAFVASPAFAGIIPLADVENGTEVTADQCKAVTETVFVKVDGQDFCVRYYLSTAGGTGDEAVVFLNGDPGCRVDIRKLTCTFGPKAKPWSTEARAKMAEQMSVAFKEPAIYFARIGQDGSSGHSALVHTQLEFDLTNAALNALKQKLHLRALDLFGHSGGAGIAATLFGVRSDVNCDVAASPGLYIADTDPYKLCTGGQKCDSKLLSYSASDRIPSMVHKDGHLYLITDPRDTQTRLDMQQPFVDAFRRAGGTLEQVFVNVAGDPHHHYTTQYGQTVMRDCLAHASDLQVEADVSRQNADDIKALLVKAQPETEPDDQGQ
jgi:hypothetical protein